MNYEKKYKEAQKWIESIYSELSHEQQMEAEAFFPELKESEDERIRKEIIETFKILGDGKIPVDINYADIFTWLEKQGDHKLAWSEEDEVRFESCIKVLQTSDGYDTINTKWFKSLKERVQAQPKQEWSEEDEKNLQGIIDEIQANKSSAPSYDINVYDRYLSWLKSLKPQKQWRPNDEQMVALSEASGIVGMYSLRGMNLQSLYNDLKKL